MSIPDLRFRPFVKKLRWGNLRNRVTLEEQILTQNETGGQEGIYVERAVVWAEIMPASGHDLWVASQSMTVVSHRIVMRRPVLNEISESTTKTVNKKFRVTFGEHIFKIIVPLDRGDILELVCNEEQPTT